MTSQPKYSPKSLIVCDAITIHKLKDINPEKFALTCLGLDLSETINILKSKNLNNFELIDLKQFSDSAAKEVSQFIVNSFTDFANENTSSNLNDSKLNVNLWYLLSVSEKSPIRMLLHQRLFFLSQISQLQEQQQFLRTSFHLSDKYLLNILTGTKISDSKFLLRESVYFLQIIRYLCNTLLIKFFSHILFRKKPILAKNMFFSLYPYWWTKPYTQLEEDRFFPKFPDNDEGFSLGHLVWLTCSFAKLIQKRKFLKNRMKSSDFIILQNNINLNDIYKFLHLGRFWKLVKFRRSVSKIGLPNFRNFNINGLFAHEISRSIRSGDFQLSVLTMLATRSYSIKNPPEKLIFRFESQPIDRALIWGVNNETTTYGYWHSSMSLTTNYTSLQFPINYLKGKDDRGLIEAGFPNMMLVPNKINFQTLTNIGFDQNRILICGPTRHLKQLAIAKELESRQTPIRKNRLAIALSADPASTKHIFDSLISIKHTFPKMYFKIKTHPAYKVSELIINRLNREIGKDSYEIIADNKDFLYEMNDCEALITTGTQLAFEGILLNITPLIFEPTNTFNSTNFKVFSKYCLIVNSVEEIKAALLKINSSNKEISRIKSNWPELIDNQFGNYPYFSWNIFLNS